MYVDDVREHEFWEAAMETDAVEALDGDSRRKRKEPSH